MNLVQRFQTFPFIAAAALLLAAVFGLSVGFVTTATPAALLETGDFASGTARPGAGTMAGGPLAGKAPVRRGSSQETARDPNNPDRDPRGTGTKLDPTTGKPPVIDVGTGPLPVKDPGKPRTLPEGRTDELVKVETVYAAAGYIDVTVSDSRGNRLPLSQSLIGLDISAGPLGWHAVPRQPVAVPAERGVFRFDKLAAGEYRVRSLASSYRPFEQTVVLSHESDSQGVQMTLEGLEYAQVEFFLRFEDGTYPEEAEIRIRRAAYEDTSTPGRFGSYPEPATGVDQPGVVPPTRYRQKTGERGVIRLTLSVGQRAVIGFHAIRDGQNFDADITITPQYGGTQMDVTLTPTDAESDGGRVTALSTLQVRLTIANKNPEFSRVNLYKSLTDFQYRAPTSIDGNRFIWQNIFSGTWYLVAESPHFHAPFVQRVEVEPETTVNFEIQTGHLRVAAVREPGSPDPSGQAMYRVRLRPQGSGTLERSYNGNLTGKQLDHIDFFVPFGQYEIFVESPENSPKLAVLPEEQTIEINKASQTRVEFTLGAASTLRFQCVTSGGAPIPNAEYLISFHAAGTLPESEKANVRKAGYDGVCETAVAPSGPVYVHVWTTSTDWANPNKVFKLDLPAYGTSNLGAVVIE